jgi:hypothetical protein
MRRHFRLGGLGDVVVAKSSQRTFGAQAAAAGPATRRRPCCHLPADVARAMHAPGAAALWLGVAAA